MLIVDPSFHIDLACVCWPRTIRLHDLSDSDLTVWKIVHMLQINISQQFLHMLSRLIRAGFFSIDIDLAFSSDVNLSRRRDATVRLVVRMPILFLE